MRLYCYECVLYWILLKVGKYQNWWLSCFGLLPFESSCCVSFDVALHLRNQHQEKNIYCSLCWYEIFVISYFLIIQTDSNLATVGRYQNIVVLEVMWFVFHCSKLTGNSLIFAVSALCILKCSMFVNCCTLLSSQLILNMHHSVL